MRRSSGAPLRAGGDLLAPTTNPFTAKEVLLVSRSPLASIATALAVLGLASAALAQPAPNGPPPAKPKIACAADVQRLCPNQPPGRGAVMRCVKMHQNEVSAACSRSAAYARQMRMERKAAAGQPGGPPAPGMTPPPPGGMAPH